MFLLLFGALFRDAGPSQTKLVQVGTVELFDQLPQAARQQFDTMFSVEQAEDEVAALSRVEQGQADAMVSMTNGQLSVRYSQADQVTAATLVGALRSVVDAANVAASGRPPRVVLDAQQVQNVSVKPIESMAPGLLGWAVVMGAVFGAAMPLVQWRTTKVLRRLRLTPASTGALIGSRSVVTVTVAILQTVLFVLIGTVVFGLRLQPSAWLGLPLIIAATLAFMGVGLIVGAVSKTAEAASGLANIVIVPMAFLSGSFVPLDVAPDWLREVSRWMPLRYLNEGLIAVVVRGQGVEAIVAPVLVLLGFALLLVVIAAKTFRWETETA